MERPASEKNEIARIVEEGIYTGIEFPDHSDKRLLYLEEAVLPTLIPAVKELLEEVANDTSANINAVDWYVVSCRDCSSQIFAVFSSGAHTHTHTYIQVGAVPNAQQSPPQQPPSCASVHGADGAAHTGCEPTNWLENAKEIERESDAWDIPILHRRRSDDSGSQTRHTRF